MVDNFITSIHNQKIKQLLLLQKSSERRSKGLFVVEGQREVKHCLDAGFEFESLFYCSELNGNAQVFSDFKIVPSYKVAPNVYSKIAYRDSTEGVIAVVKSKHLTLDAIAAKGNPLIIVLETVEKPGNLGAILRSADAAGVDAVIVCDSLTDIYNPNLIRSSIGAIFTVPCVTCDSQDCIAWLKTNNIQILTAQLQDSELYYNFPMTSGTAIVMGTEATGLTQQWRDAADAHVRIPMLGKLDSLNVSVSAAILMYEAVRQRAYSH